MIGEKNGKFSRNEFKQCTPELNIAPQNTDKSAVMKEICAKWSKFSEQDVAAIKGKADLVSQVVTKYGLPQTQAQSEVDALLKGRQVGAGA